MTWADGPPLADPTTLTPASNALVFDRLVARIVPWADAAGFRSTAADGRLIGPLNPALLNPPSRCPCWIYRSLNASTPHWAERIREVVVLTVGAVWQADYQLYAYIARPDVRGCPRTLLG